MPDLLDVRAQRVAEVLFQRHVAPHEVQHQLVALEAGRQTPLASDAGLVVAPFEVAERPVAVEHLQRAADVAQADRETCCSGSSNGWPPTAGVGASARRAARATSASRSSPCRGDRASGPPRRFLGQGRQQRLVELDVVALGLEPAGRGREGMRRLGRQSHRLAPAVRRQVHLELDRPSIRAFPCRVPAGRGTCGASTTRSGSGPPLPAATSGRRRKAARRHPPRRRADTCTIGPAELGAGCSAARGPIQLADFGRKRQADCSARSPTAGTTSAAWPGRCGPPDRRSCSRRCRRGSWRGCRSRRGASAHRRSARGSAARRGRISAAPPPPGRSSTRTAGRPDRASRHSAAELSPASGLGRLSRNSGEISSPSAWPRIEQVAAYRSTQPLDFHAAETVAGKHSLQPATPCAAAVRHPGCSGQTESARRRNEREIHVP